MELINAPQQAKNGIILEHPAISLVQCWDLLLEAVPPALEPCCKFSTFCSRIDRIAKKIAVVPMEESNSYYYQSGRDASNKFKGDVFEIFCETIIRLSPLDDRINISEYHVITEGDTGCDGHGKNSRGEPVAVQCKYRTWNKILDENNAELDNFDWTASTEYEVDTKSLPGKLVLITSGRELSWESIYRYEGAMRCISRDASCGCIKGAPTKTVDSIFSLKTLVDDNCFFWQTLIESVNSFLRKADNDKNN